MFTLALSLLMGCPYLEPPPPPIDPVVNAERRETYRDGMKAAMGPAYDAPVPGLEDADRVRGQEVFAKSCSGCHGAYGLGDGPTLRRVAPPKPPNIVDPTTSHFFSDAAQMAIIRAGSPGTAMPPMARSLSDENLLAAYAYITSLREAELEAVRAQGHE